MDDIELYDGMSLSDVFKQVAMNTLKNKSQIEDFVSLLANHINSPSDASVIGPIIKDFLDVGVRNDEHWIKMATVVQRLESSKIAAAGNSSDSSGILTELEKNQLLQEADTERKKIAKDALDEFETDSFAESKLLMDLSKKVKELDA